MIRYNFFVLLFTALMACKPSSEQTNPPPISSHSTKVDSDTPMPPPEIETPAPEPQFDTIWRQTAFFMEGTIDRIPIQVYFNTHTIRKDSSLLKGSYWYTKHYRPIPFDGTQSKQHLVFNTHNEELFDLQDKNHSLKGTWTNGNKPLACYLQPVSMVGLDLIECVNAFRPNFDYLIDLSNEYLVIDRALFDQQEESVGARISAFNNWEFVLEHKEDPEERHTASHRWLRLAGPKQAFLYIKSTRHFTRIKVEEQGATLTPLVDYTVIETIELIQQQDQEWERTALDDLVTAINTDIDIDGGGTHWHLSCSPSVLSGNAHKWVWNGSSFKKH